MNIERLRRLAGSRCLITGGLGFIGSTLARRLVALGADCVVYTSQAETRPKEALDEMTRFLRAGINVVGTSMVWLVAPRQAGSWLRKPLEQACAEGASTLYINGLDPGFSGDTLVHTALSLLAGFDPYDRQCKISTQGLAQKLVDREVPEKISAHFIGRHDGFAAILCHEQK